MSSLNLSVRYAREVTDPGVRCLEDNFELGNRSWDLLLSQCALVMVDCWSVSTQSAGCRSMSRMLSLACD